MIRTPRSFPRRRDSHRGIRPRAAAAAGLAAALAACASTPIDLEERGAAPAPVTASEVADASAPAEGEVLWGGTIIASTPLESGSQLEIVAYPLDRTQRPQLGRASEGRFLVESGDYLEPLDFAEGREVTVLGALEGVEEGRVGEARRDFPVVRATDLHLWRGEAPRSGTGFTFGIGIGSGGRTSGGIGIGIGR